MNNDNDSVQTNNTNEIKIWFRQGFEVPVPIALNDSLEQVPPKMNL